MAGKTEKAEHKFVIFGLLIFDAQTEHILNVSLVELEI